MKNDPRLDNLLAQVMPKEAEREIEIVAGSDRLIRVNVDGLCVLRVRLGRVANLVVRRDDVTAIYEASEPID